MLRSPPGTSISTTFPGTATLTTAASATPFKFDVYPIDATHLKFIEIDSAPSLVGDAFTQTSSIPAGNNVFTIAGLDIDQASRRTNSPLQVFFISIQREHTFRFGWGHQ
jgi:hypothetical protein